MDIFEIFSSITMLVVVKILIIILMGVYVVFAFLIFRQIGVMTRAVTMRDGYVVKVLGTLHLLFAILTLIVALSVL